MGKARSMRRNGIPAAGLMALLAAAVLILPVAAAWAQVIENPAKPKARDAGRIVTAQEVLAITDDGTDDYYFKWPRGLNTALDGSLALLDENQILLFDKNGKFRANLFKKGQGPGEAAYVGACLFAGDKTVVQASSPDKLMYFDKAGNYEREIPVRAQSRAMMTALFFHGDTLSPLFLISRVRQDCLRPFLFFPVERQRRLRSCPCDYGCPAHPVQGLGGDDPQSLRGRPLDLSPLDKAR